MYNIEVIEDALTVLGDGRPVQLMEFARGTYGSTQFVTELVMITNGDKPEWRVITVADALFIGEAKHLSFYVIKQKEVVRGKRMGPEVLWYGHEDDIYWVEKYQWEPEGEKELGLLPLKEVRKIDAGHNEITLYQVDYKPTVKFRQEGHFEVSDRV